MVAIRIIDEKDTEDFHRALSSVVNEGKFLLTQTPPSLSDTAEFIRNNIDTKSAQYVAELNGDIIGWADILPRDLPVMRHVGLLGMGVVAVHRGKGIGSELLEKTLTHAFDSGLKRIELEVYASNASAIKLYQKFGFELEGTKRNGRIVNDAYEDVHFMALCRL